MQNKFELKPSVPNKIVDENGNIFSSARALGRHLGVNKGSITQSLRRRGFFSYDGVKYMALNPKPIEENKETEPQVVVVPHDDEDEYQEFRKTKDVQALPFEVYDFKYTKKTKGSRYAVALFSDAHIEETVKPNSVLGLNEYNIDIAKERIMKYFENLSECLKVDEVDDLIFGSLGDTISGYIHNELEQCNGMSPIEATFMAQSLIYSGLKMLVETTKLKSIKFIGIVGNHSRTTKKIQHANGYKLSYEWLMYKNIESQCQANGLPIEFCIPEAELAIINTPDNKKFIFCHGFQVRGGGNGTVCGIYPSLNRLALKWGKTIGQDKIYLGHYHQCVSIPNAVVNGSIIGYNAFALTNGCSYEEPAQMYEVYDTNIGQLLTRMIYCK